MTLIPPLPDPALNQPPAERRIMAARFIQEARQELNSGNRLSAGEKAWAAAVQYLKIIAEARGWRHISDRQLESVGKHLAAEYPEYARRFATALADAYHKGHENFYENRRNFREVREAVEGVEEALPALEALTTEEPRPFRINSISELRRLKAVTGNNRLEVEDTSEVGFSLRHTPDPPGAVRDALTPYAPTVAAESAAVQPLPLDAGTDYPPQLQPLVRNLMKTLLEDYPGLLSEDDRRNLLDRDYCQGRLGLQLGGFALLRRREDGRIISGHGRYWQKVYAGRYFVTKEWWRKYHRHNAERLFHWVADLIDRNAGQPGITALERHRAAFQKYLGQPE